MKKALFALFVLLALTVSSYRVTAQYQGYNVSGLYGANKLRGTTLSAWFHGSNFATGAGWCGEGVYAVASGAGGMLVNRVTNGLANYVSSVFACFIKGNSGITDVTVRFVVESYDSAQWVNNQVTCQWPVLNNTGSTLSPTLSVKTGASQDASWTNVDVNAVALQTISNGATGILQYTFTGSTNMINGVSIDVDFGNNFGSTSNNIQIGGGFNCRLTPDFPTGQVPAAYWQPPDMPTTAADYDWCLRFFVSTWDNNVAIGQSTHNGIQSGFAVSSLANVREGPSFNFPVRMRAAPTVTFYDGAAGSGSVANLSGTTWTDGVSVTVTPVVTATGFLMPTTAGAGGASNQQFYIHYTADATLLGN